MHFFHSSIQKLQTQTEARLKEHTSPSLDFFILIGLSSAIVSLGLLLDNTSVIIGGMVVAPLLTPIFGLSLRIILFRPLGMMSSLISIFLGSLCAIVLAMFVGYLVLLIEGKDLLLTSEILYRAAPNLLFFLVAFFSGLAGAYAYVKPEVLSSVTGIAISVALVPPLAVTGLGIAMNELSISTESFILFLLNFVGICLGSIFMFLILGFGTKTT